MTQTQKIIKYFAIALACLLIVSIFYSLFGIISNIFGLSLNKEDNEYTIETITNDIDELDIELDFSKLSFKIDKDFKIETNNEYIKVKKENSKITITEKSRLFNFNDVNNVVIIYVPYNQLFDLVSIETGRGTIDIDDLKVNNLELDLGAGAINVDELNVYGKADIDSGAGKLAITSGNINNLDLDMGVGEVIINGVLIGNNDIDAGIGSLKLNLMNSINNYNFTISKGIGEIKINNEVVNNNYRNTLGSNNINIDGGIGTIKIQTVN